MMLEHDPQAIHTREFHALHAYLSMAIPMAEQLCTYYPDDRAMQRLCIHLYDALELMLREPLDVAAAPPELLGIGRSPAA